MHVPTDRGVRGSTRLIPPERGQGLRWRVLLDGAVEGSLNMARDHALAATLPEGEAVLRLYRWRHPTLSLGRNEPARGQWDETRLRATGVDVVRRPTGGRAVLHDGEVTYAVVLPLDGKPVLRRLYRAINEALVEGLRTLGVPAALVGDEGRVGPLDGGPCFAGPAPGEVSAAGRKLVGSAQARVEGRLLQHGSILLRDDQRRLAALRRATERHGPGTMTVPPATLEVLLGRTPEPVELIEPLVRGFRRRFRGDWPDGGERGTLTPEAAAAEARLHAHYRSPDWTWRR